MENRVLRENCHWVINKKWKRESKKKEQRCCRKPANWKRRTYSCDFLPSQRECNACSTFINSSLRTLLLPFTLLKQETLWWKCLHLATFLNGPACADLLGQIGEWLSRTNLQSPLGDLLPGDHLKIKVVVYFLPGFNLLISLMGAVH